MPSPGTGEPVTEVGEHDSTTLGRHRTRHMPLCGSGDVVALLIGLFIGPLNGMPEWLNEVGASAQGNGPKRLDASCRRAR